MTGSLSTAKRRLFETLTALDARLTASVQVSDRQISISRIVMATGLLAFGGLIFYGWADDLPLEYFNPPPGLPRLVLALPLRLPLSVLDVLIRILCLGLILGVRARMAAPMMGFSILYANCFIYSIGKIDHDYNILIVALICLGLGSEWGRRHAVLPDPPRTVQSHWGAKLLALAIGIGMFTAGYGKALSWIDLDSGTSGFIAWYRDARWTFGHRNTVLGGWIVQLPLIVLEAVDYLTVLLELTPMLMILLGRRWWLGWLVAANLFHLGVFLALKISFLPQSLTYLAFNSWTVHEDPSLSSLTVKRRLAIIVTSAIAISVLAFWLTDKPGDLLIPLAFVSVFALQIRGIWIEKIRKSTGLLSGMTVPAFMNDRKPVNT